MMSAPSATRRRACAIAVCGSRKRPPSENQFGRDIEHAHDQRAPLCQKALQQVAAGRQAARGRSMMIQTRSHAIAFASSNDACGFGKSSMEGSRNIRPSIADDRRQFLGALDPALSPTFTDGNNCTKFALPIGLASSGRPAFRVAEFEFVDGFDAGRRQQFRIFPADAFDAHAVGRSDPVEDTLVVGADLRGDLEPLLRRLGAATNPWSCESLPI